MRFKTCLSKKHVITLISIILDEVFSVSELVLLWLGCWSEGELLLVGEAIVIEAFLITKIFFVLSLALRVMLLPKHFQDAIFRAGSSPGLIPTLRLFLPLMRDRIIDVSSSLFLRSNPPFGG